MFLGSVAAGLLWQKHVGKGGRSAQLVVVVRQEDRRDESQHPPRAQPPIS